MQATSNDRNGSLTLWTEAQLAEDIGVSLRTIRYWRTQGKLPYLKLNNTIRFRPESVAAALAKLEKGGV
jgi:DNA-binding transcriptional MerR regulator